MIVPEAECGIEDHFTITYCFKIGCTLNQGGVCLAKQNRQETERLIAEMQEKDIKKEPLAGGKYN